MIKKFIDFINEGKVYDKAVKSQEKYDSKRAPKIAIVTWIKGVMKKEDYKEDLPASAQDQTKIIFPKDYENYPFSSSETYIVLRGSSHPWENSDIEYDVEDFSTMKDLIS